MRDMSRLKLRYVLLTAALPLVFAFRAPAQFVRGAIVGTITDESGAVIAGAKITLQNVGTNETRKNTTDARGDYIFPALLPGVYRAEAHRDGFKTQVVSDIHLEVNQTARIDIKLPIGQIAERVEVTASPTLLKTDTSDIGHVVTNKQIVELPLNGRDYLQLARLIPGVVPSRAGATAGERGVSRSVNSVGARDTSVSFLLDGVDTNDISFQTPSVAPSVDAIQEFKVLQNVYSAEFGRGATQILTALRSGTNQWRGTLFEFLRNDKLSARSFFQVGKPGALKQNQFGGVFGGPILRDRTFFFLNYEGQRVRTGGSSFAWVPTPEQIKGDFSASGLPRIYDPLTFQSSTRTRQQFPGNRIPADRMSEVGKKVAAIYPAPNYVGFTGRNYIKTLAQQNDNNQGNMRVDHQFTPKDSFFARYSVLDFFRTSYGVMPMSGTLVDARGTNSALNWVHTFSGTVLNELRVGFNRYNYLVVPEGSLGDNPARDYFGFKNTTTDALTAFGLPQFILPGGGYAGLGPGAYPQSAITQTWQLVDNVTWVRGEHNLKIGVDFRRTRLTQQQSAQDRGQLTFAGQFTNLPGVSGTGDSFADVLLGFPSVATAAVGDQVAHEYNRLYTAYVHDDWKLSKRLTLNIGVRYEYASPWYEKLDRLAMVDFNDARGRLLLAGTSKAFVPVQGVVDSGRPRLPRGLFDADGNNWAPRTGLAFRVNNRTVARGGYGLFYDVVEGNELLLARANPPFYFIQSYTADPFLPDLKLDTLFPSAATLPSGAIQPRTSLAGARTPYVQQWNFNFERTVLPNLLWELGYVGSKGTHLLRRTNFQQWEGILVKDPANPTPLASRVRYPNFSTTSIIGSDDGGSSTYHGLITKVEKRFSKGLAFLASYTWSKAIDDAHSSSNFDGSSSNAQCRCDLRGNKGPSAYDITQRVVLSYSYELPFGKDKRFLNSGGVANKLAGGWQISGITSAQSGPPFTLNTPGDNANIGQGAGSSNVQRPNLVGDPFQGIDRGVDIKNRGVNTGTYYFNRAAFAMPPAFRLGNLGKNALRGPGFSNWDLSLFKNTAITERLKTQFRAEFFDAFNQTAFGLPGLTLNSPTFGVISGASGRRIIQFGLKLQF